ncbi:helix-turn-helix domain-containing protein [Bacillus cereus]
MNQEVLGKNIRKLRAIKGVNQTEFAKAMSVSVSAVSSWEKGEKKPRLNKISQIASYFNVTEAYLLTHNIRDEDLWNETEEEPIERLARLLYDRFMSVPDKYKAEVERELIRYADLLKLEANLKNENNTDD